jgi:hypothetical protein
MLRTPCLSLSGLVCLMLVAGCGGTRNAETPPGPSDAAISDALADPIMTDPDLTSQNEAHAAIVVSDPVSSALPPIDRSDRAIEAAEQAAASLLGRTIPDASQPTSDDLAPFRQAVTAEQVAAAARLSASDCARDLRYTAQWAAKLPGPVQVYPRASVDEAAGSDAAGCGLRVVHFRTPVAVDDVVAFYHARLRAAGFSPQHVSDGRDHVVRGRKGALSALLYVRGSEHGLTAADLVVAGP